ncbi:MAG: threonine--tRNA ligase [Chloroflexi bacterium]|nr:MAG: threonine--tRNA ligase [Chloroflexota bacterium]
MLLESQPQESNNHRRWGRDLGLFTFSAEVGSGLPLWQPKGAILRDTLERFLRQEQLERGYLPVVTPHIGRIDLYKTSGHWYKYRESMFPPMVEAHSNANERDRWTYSDDSCSAPSFGERAISAEDDGPRGEVYILKPMNCPHHIYIYKSELHSYRDLPLRLAEFGTVYRYEQSGELNGLLRTRDFTVDDSHIFLTPEQVEGEFVNVVKLALFVFHTLQLGDFSVRVGLRDPASSKYIGSDEAWQQAQTVIMRAVEKLGIPYRIEKGEAGFYGPKLDFLFPDALGRQWQLGTAQVDYNLPARFDLTYVGEDGQLHRPVMIHRANFGSMERMIAILLEHYAGALPAWLAPVQVKLIPISDRHMVYAQEVAAKIRAAGVRVEVDTRGERMNAKVRDAQLQKIPYILVVGDKEAAEHAVSVRLRTNENLGAMPLSSFVDRITKVINEKKRDL